MKNPGGFEDWRTGLDVVYDCYGGVIHRIYFRQIYRMSKSVPMCPPDSEPGYQRNRVGHGKAIDQRLSKQRIRSQGSKIVLLVFKGVAQMQSNFWRRTPCCPPVDDKHLMTHFVLRVHQKQW